MKTNKQLVKEVSKVKIVNSDVYCKKCGVFLGMTCDPFRSDCDKCFK